jgi:pyruvate,orthophosphate dikinase
MPEIHDQLLDIAHTLEDHYRDMQDMEFTIEEGKLYMLQCRNGKRTAKAALKIANDLVKEGKITKEEAVLSVDPRNLDTLLHGSFSKATLKNAVQIGKGLPAAPGAACGKIVSPLRSRKLLQRKARRSFLYVVRPLLRISKV